MKYNVEGSQAEFYQGVEIEADSAEEAEEKYLDMWNEGMICKISDGGMEFNTECIDDKGREDKEQAEIRKQIEEDSR